MKILVMGAGAIGSVFGGFLAKSGCDVYLIGREPYIRAIQDRGLKISGIWGDHLIRNFKSFTSAGDIDNNAFDVIFLSTKSFDTEESVRKILPLIGADTIIIALQNGLGNIDTIKRVSGKGQVLGARVIFGVELVEMGHFRVTVIADKVLIGSTEQDVPIQKIEEIASVIDRAGIPTAASTEIEKFMWMKVLYNCCLNATSALLDTCYGKLGDFEATREIIGAVIGEVLAVAKGRGVDTGFADRAAYEKFFYETLLPPTYAHHPSTLQDLKNGKKTEIDSLNGAIVRMGRELGIPTPVNWTLTQLIHGKENVGPDPS